MLKSKLPAIDSVSRKSIQTIFLRGTGVVITYGLTLFITNIFSEDLVGKLNFSNNILFVLGSICLFGANQSIYQISGKYGAHEDRWILKNIYFKFIKIATLVLLMILLVLYAIPEVVYETIANYINFKSLIIKISFFSFFYFISILNFEVLRILDLIKTSEFFRSIFRTAVFSISVFIIYKLEIENWLVDVFLVSFFITAIITSIIVAFYLIGSKPADLLQDSRSLSVRKVLIVSFPMAITGIILLLMQGVDSIFIIKYASFTQLAYYSIAVKITILISIVLTSTNTIIAPYLSKYYFSNNMMELKKIILKSNRLNFILAVPIILAMIIVPGLILSFFGENYISAKSALMVLAIGQLVSVFCGSTGLYLNMTEKQNIFMYMLVLALLLNIILNFFLVPNLGILGAAISSSISLAFWNIASLLKIYKVDKVKTYFRI